MNNNNPININYITNDSDLALYKSLIEEHIKTTMPDAVINAKEQANIILGLFIGSRNIRQGPQPCVEQQAAMLKVIKEHIALKAPIPILIPSGPKKTKNDESVDLAELNVLKNLKCLNESVINIYPAGFSYLFRMEDSTGIIIEGQEVTNSVHKYISQFQQLIELLNMDSYTKLFRESTAIGDPVQFDNYKAEVNKYSNIIYEYLMITNDLPEAHWASTYQWKTLNKTGWIGSIPNETREHYFKKYMKLYPNSNIHDLYRHLSLYFACSLQRSIARITGKEKFPNGFLSINYSSPSPGVTESLFSTSIFYRSISLKQSKHNIPFWRAKGIYKIAENNKIRRSLISWTNFNEDIHQGSISFAKGNYQLSIKADSIFI